MLRIFVCSAGSLLPESLYFLRSNNYLVGDKKSANTLICRFTDKLDASFLSSLPNLKTILSITTGVTHIDLEYARKKSLRVITLRDNMKDLASITSSSEHALMLVMCAVKHMSAYTSQGILALSDEFNPGSELVKYKISLFSETTIGIVGLGRIGSYVAKMFTLLGGSVIYMDKEKKNCSYQRVSKGQLSSADLLLISCDLNSQSKDILDESILADCDITSIVNIAREECVNYTSLFKFLDRDVNNSYYTDVFDSATELQLDIYNNSPNLWNQIFITPHVAGLSMGSMRQADMIGLKLLFDQYDENYCGMLPEP